MAMRGVSTKALSIRIAVGGSPGIRLTALRISITVSTIKCLIKSITVSCAHGSSRAQCASPGTAVTSMAMCSMAMRRHGLTTRWRPTPRLRRPYLHLWRHRRGPCSISCARSSTATSMVTPARHSSAHVMQRCRALSNISSTPRRQRSRQKYGKGVTVTTPSAPRC